MLSHSTTESDLHDIEKLLIACIVFIWFEGVRGDYAASQLHMDNGRAICKQNAQRLRCGARRNDVKEIQQALARWDLPAPAFSDTSSPYHYTLDVFLSTDPILIPWAFRDLGEAKVSLIDLSRWMMVIGHYLNRAHVEHNNETIEAEKALCEQRIILWKNSFDQLPDSTTPITFQSQLRVLNLRQWYHGTQAIIIRTSDPLSPETKWDLVSDDFQALLEPGEAIIHLLLPTVHGAISFSYDLD